MKIIHKIDKIGLDQFEKKLMDVQKNKITKTAYYYLSGSELDKKKYYVNFS